MLSRFFKFLPLPFLIPKVFYGKIWSNEAHIFIFLEDFASGVIPFSISQKQWRTLTDNLRWGTVNGTVKGLIGKIYWNEPSWWAVQVFLPTYFKKLQMEWHYFTGFTQKCQFLKRNFSMLPNRNGIFLRRSKLIK